MTVVAPERVVASGGAPKKRSGLLVVLVIGAIIGAGIGFVIAPKDVPDAPWQRLASLSEVPADEVLAVDWAGVLLTLDEAGDPVAMSAFDGRGQPVTYCESSGWLEDRNHGSKFDRLGRYALGPAPRGLDRFAVLVLGGHVFVDWTQVIPGPPRLEPKAAEPVGPFCGEIREDHS